MKRIMFAIAILLVSLPVVAQEDPFYNGSLNNRNNPMFRPGGFGNLRAPTAVNTDKKMDVGVQIGTSFTTNFNGGHAFSLYAAPEIRYRVSDKFTIRGGVSIANTDYGNTLVFSPYGYSQFTGNVTQGMLYVSGDYLISPKVILTGTAYKEFSIDHGNPETGFQPGYDGKGLMMNLRLMPTENMIIDIGAEIYEGNNPWRNGAYDPYNRPFRPQW